MSNPGPIDKSSPLTYTISSDQFEIIASGYTHCDEPATGEVKTTHFSSEFIIKCSICSMILKRAPPKMMPKPLERYSEVNMKEVYFSLVTGKILK